MEIEENLKTSLLLETYGPLLTDKQRSVLRNFCDNNMSLGEIADDLGVSRQAVRDIIKRTVDTLNSYEDKLKLLDKFNSVKVCIDTVADKMAKARVDSSLIEELRKILEEL